MISASVVVRGSGLGGGGGVGVAWRVADNQEQDTLEISNVCYSYLFRTHSICFNQTRLEYVSMCKQHVIASIFAETLISANFPLFLVE